MISIRRRLLAGLLTTIGAVWLAIAAMVYHVAQHEAQEVFDAQLAQYARVLQALAAPRARGERPARLPVLPVGDYDDALPGSGHRYERKLRFHVWDAQGRLLMSSQAGPTPATAPAAAGYGTEAADGHAWRTFALITDPGAPRVYVAERDDVRGELVQEVVVRQLAPGLLALPVFGLVVWVVVGRGLRSLKRAAAEVARRSPAQLEPLRVADAPAEIRPLVDALNRLFERLRIAFERERRFIADAAHELRTPIAAIKTQAQVAADATDPEQRRRALANIVRGVDRATHLEAQLLTLARLDPEARASVQRRPVALARLARAVLAELAPEAIAKHIDLTLDADDHLTVAGDPDLLAILLRNLVHNAVQYTPAGGAVAVVLGAADGAVHLRVLDTGPGIPPDEGERVFERFYRGRGGNQTGSGLGLSIARRIAELHGAGLTLANRAGGGLAASLHFAAVREAGATPGTVETAP